MNRPASAALTVAELAHGPLPGVRIIGAAGTGGEVHDVRIVDQLDALDTLRPHTAVVLAGTVARTGWTVEMALRKAWEHAAACVVVPDLATDEESVGTLAERLAVPLLLTSEDTLAAAVRIASAVARPEAGRTALLARAAQELADAGPRADAVLSTLHAVLSATTVALTDGAGNLLAGRRAALDASKDRSSPPPVTRVTVEVPGPDRRVLGRLVATVRGDAPGWPGTVEDVLRLAVAPLTAWAAERRLLADRDSRFAGALLRRLLADGAPDPALRAEAVALGWPVSGPLVAFAIRQAGESDTDRSDIDAALRAVWPSRGHGPLVVHDDTWVAWQGPRTPARQPGDEGTEGEETRAEEESRLRQAVKDVRKVVTVLAGYAPLAAAVAGPGGDLAELTPLLESADAAAQVAAAAGAGTVVRADQLGPAQMLAAVPAAQLRGTAEAVMARLLAVDPDGSLRQTLTAVLDTGAAPSAAAVRLGVHRNTVAARMDRIRALGYDIDDPQQRLALHLACHVLGTPPH
ncbi:PucR family transcriptional regulator [Streptomyces sp. R-07]|uniref:PucR family transcriptional regulator n=1 Tax=unclassified Streptomyces TaxID=2593676 RepID=UPI00341651B4